MGILTQDMRRVLDEQQRGSVATVCPDGTPNRPPKGTTAVWDDAHLVFADICSPTTIANLRQNPVLEIDVVDTLTRKGYRFKGRATILSKGERFDELLEFPPFHPICRRSRYHVAEGRRLAACANLKKCARNLRR